MKPQLASPVAALPARHPADTWPLPAPYTWRTVLAVVAAFMLLVYTGHRTEMDRMLRLSGEAVLASLGLKEDSQVLSGFSKLASAMFPPQVSERTELARIEGFDRDRLPAFSRIEVDERIEQSMNPKTLQMESRVERREVLVEPLGYLGHVLVKMLETLEIALWGTVVAVVLSLPLAFYGAANYTSNRATYGLARSAVSLFRAVPELVSALFLVLAFGFGPIAGVLALGIHAAGFLGKFYAEDIENADDKPQEALRAIGASRLKVLRAAVLPQVWPQYIAYTLYILDRNVRMATVVGIVGAGGIGQELKGRYDLYNYSHVATILLVIFLTVLLLDLMSARLRSKFL
jgi:phosphonate transport system permease protein